MTLPFDAQIKIISAVTTASTYHGNQKYGEHNYIKHLNDVYDVLIEFGFSNSNLLQAAYLHDILEDTDMTEQRLREIFSKEVIDIVVAVTDAEGKNRKERKQNTYPKIKGFEYATIIKLADRVANVRNCIASGNVKLLEMYKKEHKSFKEGIFVNQDSTRPIWTETDNLLKE